MPDSPYDAPSGNIAGTWPELPWSELSDSNVDGVMAKARSYISPVHPVSLEADSAITIKMLTTSVIRPSLLDFAGKWVGDPEELVEAMRELRELWRTWGARVREV